MPTNTIGFDAFLNEMKQERDRTRISLWVHCMKILLACLMIYFLPLVDGQQTPPSGASDPGKSTGPALSAVAPQIGQACRKLKSAKIHNASITDVSLVPAGPFAIPGQDAGSPSFNVPAFCRAQAVLKPTRDSEIRFEVWMPLSGWNGRFEQVGNGGFAGNIAYGPLETELLRGYSVASTNDGHEGSVTDASWAVGHPERIIDYGYRAVHETNKAAKEFIRDFYGTAPSYSYFDGCSGGGREALMEAQRFPKDFNGIIAGAPANFFTHLMAEFLWNQQVLSATPESYIPANKLPAIQSASLAACDASDGVQDGILESPQNCHIDPSVLQCKSEDGPDCLTAPQIEAVRKLYDGPHDPRTGRLIFPGYEPGAEANPWTWAAWIIGKTPGSGVQSLFGKEFFAEMVFQDPKWDFHTFDLTEDTKAADLKLGPILNSIDPDLRVFKTQGGKLIQYHGWADAAVAPLESVHYYESVVEEMGGLEKTQDFYRLFMVPGMEHCGGGPGPNTIRWGLHPSSPASESHDDVLNSLVQWVEHGVAPEEIIAAKFTDNDPEKAIVETRPLCPYPQFAKYKGNGSTHDAKNFACYSNGERR